MSTVELTQSFSSEAPGWNIRELQGRLVELSESRPTASLSFAIMAIHQAQENGCHAGWISHSHSIFYPPDACDNGIDLKNLPVLHMRDMQSAGRAAEILLRSGAFHLLVVDLGKHQSVSIARLAQLGALARKHKACVLFLTEKQSSEQSLGPLICMHARTGRKRTAHDEFSYQIDVSRDKQRGRPWSWQIRLAGIDGYY